MEIVVDLPKRGMMLSYDELEERLGREVCRLEPQVVDDAAEDSVL